MTDADELLVLLTAIADAVLLGLRAHEWRAGTRVNANRFFALQDFADRGVQVPSATGGAAANVARQRLLERLESNGLVAVRRRRGEKFPYARLTCAADRRARQLCGLPGLECGHAWLVKLAGLSARADNIAGSVDEFCFLNPGEEPTGRGLVLVEDMALPALARGWSECHSAATGLVHYWPTDAGRAAAAGPPPAGLPPLSEAETRDAFALYLEAFAARRAALRGDVPRSPAEIGPVPLLPFRTTFKGAPDIAARLGPPG